MISIRTDLALEAREIYEDEQQSSELPGVKVETKQFIFSICVYKIFIGCF